MKHHELCNASKEYPYLTFDGAVACECEFINKISIYEREQAAQRILAIDDEENNDYWRDGVHEALAAARGGDSGYTPAAIVGNSGNGVNGERA